jgi:hypothetical protein
VAGSAEGGVGRAYNTNTGLGDRHGPTGGRMRPPSGWTSFDNDNGQAGFWQGIAIPHASARFTWCALGSSGWRSQTQPSAHRPQVFTAMPSG